MESQYLEKKLSHLDNLFDLVFNMVTKIELKIENVREIYECTLAVPLSINIHDFSEELSQNGFWVFELKSVYEYKLQSIMLFDSLKINSNLRIIVLGLYFPKDFNHPRASYCNKSLNVNFESSPEWRAKIESYRNRTLDLYIQSNNYFNS